jgi:hypothetical protein
MMAVAMPTAATAVSCAASVKSAATAVYSLTVDGAAAMVTTYFVANRRVIEGRMMADVVVIFPWMMNDEGRVITPRVSPSP